MSVLMGTNEHDSEAVSFHSQALFTPTSEEHLLMSHRYMTASAANGQTADSIITDQLESCQRERLFCLDEQTDRLNVAAG